MKQTFKTFSKSKAHCLGTNLWIVILWQPWLWSTLLSFCKFLTFKRGQAHHYPKCYTAVKFARREFKERRRRRWPKRERKKVRGLDWQNKNSARASPLLHISFPSWHDHNMKVPNFTFCGGHEHKTIFVVVFFYNLDTVFWNSTPQNVTNITKLNDTE